MAEKKITKRESFTEIRNVLMEKGYDRLAKVMEHDLELLEKKNASKSANPTPTQVANGKIKEEILECMGLEPHRMFTISEMMKAFPCCEGMANQRVSALVRQLKEDGKVERIEDKRKAYFRIVQ